MKTGNNKGYSLVELLLAIFILALVMAGVVSIMRATSVSYRNGNSEVTVQTEAQIVANQIEELLVDADTSVSYNSSTGIYTIVNHGASHQLKFDSSESTIQYKSGSGSWSLMAEYVEGFSIDGISTDTSEVACDNKVTVNVTMNNQGYKYTAVKDVYYRNAIENTSVQLLAGTGGSGSSSSSENVVYVDVKRYDIIDLEREYDFNVTTLSASPDLTSKYDFVEVEYNSEISNKSLALAIAPDDIKVPADPAATTGFLRTGTGLIGDWTESIAKDNTKYWIKGKTKDDPSTTANEAKDIKFVFYTDAVSYDLKTAEGKSNASGYAVLLTPSEPGSGEKYIAYVEPKGVDLAMMLNTTDNEIKFAMVAYKDAVVDATTGKGDLTYNGTSEKWVKDPLFGTVSAVGMSNANCPGRVADGAGWWLNLAVGVDEESGALVIHQKEKMSDNASACVGDFSDGDKRLAVMIFVKDATFDATTFGSTTCQVVDFNICMQGEPISSYFGGNTYTSTFSSWGKASLDF
ncbi:MAG: prepilin-type N-terminal cleavage/methylation domain-containing protein [Lachnospiraceae bacterium]|nr:prepilin-type N-terminal cleavage/methylation domain-containing protein [Lachnospiraceae bacterium]